MCALGLRSYGVPSSAGAKSAAYPDLEAFVDEVMKAQMEKYDMTNAAVAVVSGRGSVSEGLRRCRSGEADAGRCRAHLVPYRIDFQIIDLTAVMQLVEQGKLDLNADINRYLDVKIPPQLIHSRIKPRRSR